MDKTEARLGLKEMNLQLSETWMAKERWVTLGWFCCVSEPDHVYCDMEPWAGEKASAGLIASPSTHSSIHPAISAFAH